jgi:hypothetical protein
MPGMCVYSGLYYSRYTALSAEVRLRVPVLNIIKAIYCIRAHVFESDEYRIYPEFQKVRSNYT